MRNLKGVLSIHLYQLNTMYAICEISCKICCEIWSTFV